MFVITFSDVCKAFDAHAKADSMSVISRRLLKLITDQEGVVNEKGEKYRIQNKELIELFKGELDIFPNIRAAAKIIKLLLKLTLIMKMPVIIYLMKIILMKYKKNLLD